MRKKALICGRGESLNYFSHTTISNNQYDFVYLVNSFNNFLRKRRDLLKFFQDQKGKIIYLLNIEVEGIDRFILRKIKFDDIICSRLHYTKENYWWRDKVDERNVKKYGRKMSYQPESLEKYMRMVENTADVAILNAIIGNECTDIFLIGIDHYHSDYFLGDRTPDYDKVSTKEVRDRLMKAHYEICEKFSKVNFTFVTYSSFDPKLNNVNIHKCTLAGKDVPESTSVSTGLFSCFRKWLG